MVKPKPLPRKKIHKLLSLRIFIEMTKIISIRLIVTNDTLPWHNSFYFNANEIKYTFILLHLPRHLPRDNTLKIRLNISKKKKYPTTFITQVIKKYNKQRLIYYIIFFLSSILATFQFP